MIASSRLFTPGDLGLYALASCLTFLTSESSERELLYIPCKASCVSGGISVVMADCSGGLEAFIDAMAVVDRGSRAFPFETSRG